MYELEFETELEGELEGEFESEQFFSRLAQLAGRALRSPTVRRIGLTAGRMALRGGLGALGAYAGGRLAGSQRTAGQVAGGGLGYGLGTYLGTLLPEQELEGEFETELNPLRRVNSAALMEHLGHAATEAESEAEAEAFIGALVPLAARLAPRVAPAIMQAAPGLIRGAATVVRQLRRSPATRRFVRTIPGIVRRTAGVLTQRVGRGQPVTPRIAVRALAQQTSQVLGSPQQAVRAWRRSRALDRRYHQAVGDLPPGAGGGGPGACPTCGRAN
jgi:hypothetical protein